jgi:hypothetical protein
VCVCVCVCVWVCGCVGNSIVYGHCSTCRGVQPVQKLYNKLTVKQSIEI